MTEQNQQQQPSENKPTGNVTGAEPTLPNDERKFSQSELDAIVRDRLERAQRKSDEAAAKARKDAEESALAEQAKWKELAERREGELASLQPKAQLADELTELLNGQLDREVSAWPKEVAEMDPGKGDVKARLTWAQKARPLAEKLLTTSKQPGVSAGPKPTGTADRGADDLYQYKLRTGPFSGF